MSLLERMVLRGKWIAMEMYDRDTRPARVIAAVGDSVGECVRVVSAKGRDPGAFEYRLWA